MCTYKHNGDQYKGMLQTTVHTTRTYSTCSTYTTNESCTPRHTLHSGVYGNNAPSKSQKLPKFTALAKGTNKMSSQALTTGSGDKLLTGILHS